MTLPLTPHNLAAAYEYLRATTPFKGWKLPPAEEVEFRVVRDKRIDGQHNFYLGTKRGEHIISVSVPNVHTTTCLLITMAHEMIHAKQTADGVRGRGHNIEFWQLARQICHVHGCEVFV